MMDLEKKRDMQRSLILLMGAMASAREGNFIMSVESGNDYDNEIIKFSGEIRISRLDFSEALKDLGNHRKGARR